MKKLIAAILAVIMLAGLTACISEDPGKGEGTESRILQDLGIQ